MNSCTLTLMTSGACQDNWPTAPVSWPGTLATVPKQQGITKK